MKTPAIASVVALAFLFLALPAGAEEEAASVDRAPAGIQWYGTWEAAKTEAQRTARPILLIAAAPHCHNVSGIW